MSNKLMKTENYYFEYTSPRTGDKRRDPWMSNHRCDTKKALFELTRFFVYLMIDEEGKDYLDGVMCNPVKVIANGKTVCEWSPMSKHWIDYV